MQGRGERAKGSLREKSRGKKTQGMGGCCVVPFRMAEHYTHTGDARKKQSPYETQGGNAIIIGRFYIFHELCLFTFIPWESNQANEKHQKIGLHSFNEAFAPCVQ